MTNWQIQGESLEFRSVGRGEGDEISKALNYKPMSDSILIEAILKALFRNGSVSLYQPQYINDNTNVQLPINLESRESLVLPNPQAN